MTVKLRRKIENILNRRSWRRPVLVLLWLVFAANCCATEQEQLDSSRAEEVAKSVEFADIVDNFSTLITDHDLDESYQRAWESRPYRVAVWLCLDGSPELAAVYPRLVAEVTNRSELMDPSSWDLAVGEAAERDPEVAGQGHCRGPGVASVRAATGPSPCIHSSPIRPCIRSRNFAGHSIAPSWRSGTRESADA